MNTPTPRVTGSIFDPEFRRQRAQIAAQARTSLDHYVEKIVSRAPELTPDQVEKLRGLLPPVSDGAA